MNKPHPNTPAQRSRRHLAQLFSRANPYYAGPQSEHFNGRRFFNPGGRPPSGFGALLRWQFGDRPSRWPATANSPFSGAKPQTRVDDLCVTMVGHATMLIQTAGMNILTDPLWSDRASPFQFAGPRRVVPPGIAFDDLPPIDLILLSHNHYDHLDLATLQRLHAACAPQIITPLGNDTILRRHIPDIGVSAHDWGDAVSAGPLSVHLDPCHHWSARSMGDRSMALWASFTLKGPAGTVLFIGDTGFDQGRPYQAVQRHGPIRLAILPVGAYEPRWFMAPQHQNPAEAVEGFLTCQAEAAIGHHWGTFQLTNEARETPLEDLAAACAAQGIAPNRFRPLQAGESWSPDPDYRR